MGEIKQANFRIDTDTAAQFREFCEANGLNQAQGFDHIMQVVEMDKAKATLPARTTEIEEFERHAKALISSYLNSLEIAESTEERLLEQFRSKLDSKDETIQDLQNKVKGMEDLLTIAQTAAMNAENDKVAAEQAAKDAQEREKSALASAKDKEDIANMLNVENIKLKSQLDGYDDLKESEAAYKTKLAEATQTIKDNQREAEIAQERAVGAIRKEMDAATSEHEKAVAELKADKDRAVAAAELQTEKKLAALEKEHKGETQRLYDKLESLQDEKATLKDSISSVKQENRDLQAEIAALNQELQKIKEAHQ